MKETPNELGVFHVEMARPAFDPSTGARLDKPKVAKFGARTFEARSPILKKMGYIVTVLYDPTEYLAERKKLHAGAKSEAIAARKSARDAAEKKRADDARKLAEAEEILKQKAIDDAAAEKVAELQKEKDAEIAKLKSELEAAKSNASGGAKADAKDAKK